MDRAPAPETQTPDMQTATGQMPQPSLTGPSIISALQSIQGPNPMLAGASAALNTLGGGRPGDNPYLAQNQVAQHGMIQQINQVRLAQEADLHRQIQLQQLQQRAQEHAVKQDNAARTVLQDMLKTVEDEGVRANYVKQLAGLNAKIGITMSESEQAAMARGGPSQTSMKELALRLSGADTELDPARKQAFGLSAQKFFLDHGGKPQDWAQVSQNLRSDAYLHSFNLPTRTDTALKLAELKDKETAAIIRGHLELKDKPEVVADAALQHLKYTGKSYLEGDDNSQQMAFAIAKSNETNRELTKLRLQEEMRGRLQAQRDASADARQRALFVQQDHLAELRYQNALKGIAAQKMENGLITAETALNQMEAAYKKIKAAGFVAEDSSYTAEQKAKIKRGDPTAAGGGLTNFLAGVSGYSQPAHPDWKEWQDLQASMVGIARGIQGDNLRAYQAIEPALGPMKNPGQGFEQIIENSRNLLKAVRAGQAQPATLAPAPGGPLTPAAPTGPKLPADVIQENGQYVSKSGKYIWKDGKWQAR